MYYIFDISQQKKDKSFSVVLKDNYNGNQVRHDFTLEQINNRLKTQFDKVKK